MRGKQLRRMFQRKFDTKMYIYYHNSLQIQKGETFKTLVFWCYGIELAEGA